MRKVLSFVLVLSLILGSFSMAFAATPASTGLTDIAGNANEEAIQVAYDLGIVTGNPDGTFLPAKAVTRAEFAAMITRALAIPESALAGYTASTFKDTAGYNWAVPYLAFCNSKGIMLGDGAGNAMPGRTINTNEAVTMVLRAIGYTNNSSELVGAWPANYVTLAQDKGLYDDLASVLSVDKANAAQIVYNALTLTKVQVATDGATTNVIGNPSMLTSGLNCTSEKATIDGTEDAVINTVKYLGQNGDVYYNSSKEIVAFISGSTKLVGKIDTSDANLFTTTVGSTDYTTTAGIASASALAPVKLLNGKTGTINYTDEIVLNVKLSGKTITQIYSVLDWQVTADDKVSAAQVKDITDDQSLLGVDFALNDDDEIDLNYFTLVGFNNL